jgi:hypothetical protein
LPRIPKNCFFDLLRLHSGAFDRRFGRYHPHSGSGERSERTSELPNGSADGGENVDVVQKYLPNI